SQGIAVSTTFTANGKAGGPYTITASTAGVAETANFSLTNTGAVIPTDTVGTFDPTTATWYLRNSNSSGATDAGTFQYGAGGWVPVTGDWNGDGITTVGAVDPQLNWYLRDNNTSGGTSIPVFQFGAPG